VAALEVALEAGDSAVLPLQQPLLLLLAAAWEVHDQEA